VRLGAVSGAVKLGIVSGAGNWALCRVPETLHCVGCWKLGTLSCAVRLGTVSVAVKLGIVSGAGNWALCRVP
jgi:hypothetical protein